MNLVVYSGEQDIFESVMIFIALLQLVGVLLVRYFITVKILYPAIAVMLVYSYISVFTFPETNDPGEETANMMGSITILALTIYT